MPTQTPENDNATASRTDKAVVCDALVSLLLAWEKCAYDHEADFFEEFGPVSAWELVKVSFRAGGVEYTALLECGVQCINSAPMEDWLKFYVANTQSSAMPKHGH